MITTYGRRLNRQESIDGKKTSSWDLASMFAALTAVFRSQLELARYFQVQWLQTLSFWEKMWLFDQNGCLEKKDQFKNVSDSLEVTFLCRDGPFSTASSILAAVVSKIWPASTSAIGISGQASFKKPLALDMTA